jgi:hypothetical protein
MRPDARWLACFVSRRPLNVLGPRGDQKLVLIVVSYVLERLRSGRWRPETGRSPSKRHGTIARNVGESFSPNRPGQGLDHRSYSPAVRAILIATAIASRSFAEAAKLVAIIAGLKVSPRHLQTLCQEQGSIGVDKQTARTAAYKERPLMTPPTAAKPPIELAAVMIDGGRVQVRQPQQGPGVHEPAWRETKTAILLRMKRHVSDVDPEPELPSCFAQPLGSTIEPAAATESATPAEGPDWKPVPLVRSGLATLSDSDTFGWMAAAAAEERGFFSATAQAFVSDGLPYNWSIQRRHFADFVPILDFVHASEHVHDAAKATGQGLELGRRWAGLCWQGRVGDVIGEIAGHQSRVAPPHDPKAEPDHPWCVLDRQRVYLENNQSRMNYPQYRRNGLPVTSSPVESWVKQLNQRVKGSEKFWNNNANPEAILNLRAAWLNDEAEFIDQIRHRPGHPYARPGRDERAAA